MSRTLRLITDYIETHGPARSRVIAKAMGLSTPYVSEVIKQAGLPRPKPKRYASHGIKLGERRELSAVIYNAVVRHARDGETVIATLDRLLRGDAKPHPACSCGLCLRSRERPDPK